ncbi:hypothetical protein [Falsiroseomonas sp. E2-1-a4]|uniref:hypothetical protein n=1 Tax=Falsiroseomonas sp. E2-1-a4 TaxID=3239299 RepID=UPI003F3C98AE
MLASDMAAIDAGQPRSRWPTCIPLKRREKLRKKYGLKSRRAAFLDCYQALGAADRVRVHDAMRRHNAFPAIFDDGQPCFGISDLPEDMGRAVKNIFELAFDLLTDLGLRDANYKLVYEHLKYKICAFCGVELLDAPGQKREALDHYLPIAAYSFPGVNFRNLSPMGTKCNSRYKFRQDIFVNPATGKRRTCCDPYDSPTISLSLNASRPFEGPRVDLVTCPEWAIQWEGGDPEKLQTWDSIFAISERYRESSLNPNFRSWIDHFCQWAARQPHDAGSPELLRSVLREFTEIIIPEGLTDSAFLKRATFQMLEKHCDSTEGGRRIFDWLHGQILDHSALAAPVAHSASPLE